LLLDDQVAPAVLLDERDLVVLLDELAGEVPADLAAAADDHVHQPATPSARSNSVIANCVGQIVSSPCSLYQAARAGSSTRAITRSTPKRFCAICEITRFVLSPLVEATNTSASAMPD